MAEMKFDISAIPDSESTEKDFGWLDTVPRGTGERSGPLYRCLMVSTGKEAYVQKLLQVMSLGECIIPKKVRITRRGGTWKEELSPMLPGYLFIHETEEIPIWRYQQLLDVIRVLRYEREPYGYMKDRDMRFAETIFRVEGTVRPLKAVNENGFIRITDEMLDDLNGTVLSVDRHKKMAKIRIDLMGITKVVYLSFVVVGECCPAETDTATEPVSTEESETDTAVEPDSSEEEEQSKPGVEQESPEETERMDTAKGDE